jgi:hypothetical protein
MWRFPVSPQFWDIKEDAGKHEGGSAAADLDGDGRLEVVTNDWAGSVYAVNDDGSQLWHYKTPADVWSGVLIADFTGDGKLDVIVEGEENETHPGYPYGMVAVLAGDTGELKAVYPMGLTASTPSIGDFDGDGESEIVAQAWSGPITVLTAGGAWDPSLAPWPYNYKNLHNNGVYPIPETLLALLAPTLLFLGTRLVKKRG